MKCTVETPSVLHVVFGAALIAATTLSHGQSPELARDLGAQQYNQLAAQVARYEEAITALEGAYNETSSELQLSLAKAYVAMGNLEDASDAYKESLQALRVSFGLYSEAQFQTLAEYNNVLFELADWEQIDRNLHLANHVASHLYDKQDARYIENATQLASWKIKAFHTGLYRADSDRSITEAARIYRVLVDDLPLTDVNYSAKRADYLSAKGLAHFYSAQYVSKLPIDAFKSNAPETVSHQQCYPLVMSVDGPQPVRTACQGAQISNPEYFASQQRAKNETVRRHLSSMRESFADAIETIEQDSSATNRELALAILNLGDASFLAQDFPRAYSQYEKAWDLLSVDGESAALRAELLGRPVRVMQDVLEEIVIDDRVRSNVLSGTITFDVTERGSIENIDIQGTPKDLEVENIGAIAIRLEEATYRPRILDGKPITARISLSASEL